MVVFELGTLQTNASALVAVEAIGVAPGTWSNAATVCSALPDFSPADNAVAAVVYVNSPPSISALPDVETFMNTPVGPIPFEVHDAETPASELVLGAVAEDPALIPPEGIELGGSDTNRTICLHPARGQVGSTRVSVIVSDGMAETTNTFQVTVWPTNHLPVLVPVPDQLVHAQMKVCVTNVATDPDAPPQTLRFSLGADSPPGAWVDPITGVFEWIPDESLLGTNIVIIQVTDDGQPPQTASVSFGVVVFERPRLEATCVSATELAVRWTAVPGCVYRVQFESGADQAEWFDVGPEVTASGFWAEIITEIVPETARFYRVMVCQ